MSSVSDATEGKDTSNLAMTQQQGTQKELIRSEESTHDSAVDDEEHVQDEDEYEDNEFIEELGKKVIKGIGRKMKVGSKRPKTKRNSILVARELAWNPSVALPDNTRIDTFEMRESSPFLLHQDAKKSSKTKKRPGSRVGSTIVISESTKSLPAKTAALYNLTPELRKLQDEITTQIIEREDLVDKIRVLIQERPISTQMLLTTLEKIRELTVTIVKGISKWRELKTGFNNVFLWKGQNYLLSVVTDLNFLARDTEVAEALNVTGQKLENNPLMASKSLTEKVSCIDTTEEKGGRESSNIDTPDQDEDKNDTHEVEHILRRELIDASLQSEERRRRTRSPTMGIHQEPSFTTSADVLERWKASAEDEVRALKSTWGLVDKQKRGTKSTPHLDNRQQAFKPRGGSRNNPVHLESKTSFNNLPDAKTQFSVRTSFTIDPTNIYRARAVTAIPSKRLQTSTKHRRRPRSSAAARLAPLSAAGLADVVQVPLPSYFLNEGSLGLLSMRSSELGAPSLRLDVHELEDTLRKENPSQEARLCFTAVLILLAPGKSVPTDLSWETIHNAIVEDGPERGARRLLDAACRVTSGSIPRFKVLALAEFLSDTRFQPDNILQANNESIAALCAWIINVVTGSPKHRRWIAQKLNSKIRKSTELDKDSGSFGGDEMLPENVDQQSSQPKEEPYIDPSSVTLGNHLMMSNYQRGDTIYSLHFFKTKTPARGVLVKCYEPASGREAAVVITARQWRTITGERKPSDWQRTCRAIKAQLEIQEDSSELSICIRLDSNEDTALSLRKVYGTARTYGPHKFSISVLIRDGNEEEVLLRAAGARGVEAGLRFEKWVDRKAVLSILYEHKHMVMQEPLYSPSLVERLLNHLRISDKGMTLSRGKPPPKPEIKDYRSVLEQDPMRLSKEDLADLERKLEEKEQELAPNKVVFKVVPANFVPRCALDPPKHSVAKYEPPPMPVSKPLKYNQSAQARVPLYKRPDPQVSKVNTKLTSSSPKHVSKPLKSVCKSTPPMTKRPETQAMPRPVANFTKPANPNNSDPSQNPDHQVELEAPRPRTAEPGEFDRRPTPKELQEDSSSTSGSYEDDEDEDYDDEFQDASPVPSSPVKLASAISQNAPQSEASMENENSDSSDSFQEEEQKDHPKVELSNQHGSSSDEGVGNANDKYDDDDPFSDDDEEDFSDDHGSEKSSVIRDQMQSSSEPVKHEFQEEVVGIKSSTGTEVEKKPSVDLDKPQIKEQRELVDDEESSSGYSDDESDSFEDDDIQAKASSPANDNDQSNVAGFEQESAEFDNQSSKDVPKVITKDNAPAIASLELSDDDSDEETDSEDEDYDDDFQSPK